MIFSVVAKLLAICNVDSVQSLTIIYTLVNYFIIIFAHRCKWTIRFGIIHLLSYPHCKYEIGNSLFRHQYNNIKIEIY